MEIFNLWKILGIIVVILLLVYFKKRGSVWGGLTMGIIIGLLIAVFFVIKGSGFDWRLVAKIGIVGTLVGFAADLLGKLGDHFKKK